MFCYNCGAEIDDKAVICVKCGVLVNNMQHKIVNNTCNSNNENNIGINTENNTNVNHLSNNTMGIIGFCLSLVSFVLSLYCIVPLAALIFSIMGYVNIKKYANKKLTIAALVISIIALVIDALFLIYSFTIASLLY